jgi:phage major head subunit gpT-like protein
MISGNVPQHLVAMAKTGFLTTAVKAVPAWTPIATMVDLTVKNQTLVDLGAAPMPTRNRGKFNAQDFIEKSLAVTPLDWELPVWISGNAVKDDQTGSLLTRVRSAGSNFQRHISQQAFQALNDGDVSTGVVGVGYDGLVMFSNSHVDKGAAYTTVQDNLNSLSLSLANFETVLTAAQLFRDDQGEFTDYAYDLLVVDPTNRRTAFNITDNAEDYSTGNRAKNPYAGKFSTLVSPKLDTGAWFVVASSETVKPILIVMREQPHLEDSWKDPEAPDGGRYYFNFTARYNFYVGDWRTASMGKS